MKSHFVTTCPRCCELQPPGAFYRCESCGCVLTIRRELVQGLLGDRSPSTLPRRAHDKRTRLKAGRSRGV